MIRKVFDIVHNQNFFLLNSLNKIKLISRRSTEFSLVYLPFLPIFNISQRKHIIEQAAFANGNE
jgi:hypothetical protein